jgi:adenylosuccinate lyase
MTAKTMDSANYQSPFSTRYASEAMRYNFSDEKKFLTWRRLWIALAEAERDLGLPISDEQVAELKDHAEDLNLAAAARYERELRHDVMAHIHAWGDVCPTARPIIHLGATSCFVGDNTDLVLLRDGISLLRGQLVSVVALLREFAHEHRELPTLGFTHFQPAQVTTVGKRACLWLQDLITDLEDLDHAETAVRFRGVKGTTGTQASFMELFDGDGDKVAELDRRVTVAMGFESTFGVTGQTYPRKLDFRVAQVLSGIAQSAHKFATDLRLLANRRELEEPFGDNQVGSSAMPWKRNPMRAERICSLGRFVISALDNTAHTAANQWLERSLDDSANRRLVLSEMFLATDALLNLYLDVAAGMVVHPPVIRRNLDEELPFLVTEALMMEAVKAGGDRQEIHEAVRRCSMEAAQAVKEGGANPMKRLLAEEPELAAVAGQLDELLEGSRHVGRAPAQVQEFLASEVDPVLERHADLVGSRGHVYI